MNLVQVGLCQAKCGEVVLLCRMCLHFYLYHSERLLPLAIVHHRASPSCSNRLLLTCSPILPLLFLLVLKWISPSLVMSSLAQQRRIVEQLRRESEMKRVGVSSAIEELKKYVLEHEADDYLLVGFHSQKANPFREKSPCVVI